MLMVWKREPVLEHVRVLWLVIHYISGRIPRGWRFVCFIYPRPFFSICFSAYLYKFVFPLWHSRSRSTSRVRVISRRLLVNPVNVTVSAEIINQRLSQIHTDFTLTGLAWPSGLLATLERLRFSCSGCQRMAAQDIEINKTKQEEGTGTNVHFEKTYNEHTVASLALLSLSELLKTSLYLALRLCRLSIAPLRQSSVRQNNGTLIFRAGCSLLLCDRWARPFICRHIMLEEVQINAPVIFPSALRRLTANEKRRLETAEAFSMDWRRRKNSP